MLGKNPNIYWIVCYLVATPVITFAIFIMAIIADSEVTLNNQKYPGWAHAIGWIIVVVVLIPIPAGFFWEWRGTRFDFKQASSFLTSLFSFKTAQVAKSGSFKLGSEAG